MSYYWIHRSYIVHLDPSAGFIVIAVDFGELVLFEYNAGGQQGDLVSYSPPVNHGGDTGFTIHILLTSAI